MISPDDLEVVDGCVVCRMTGEIPLEKSVNRVTEAIEFARTHGIRNLLVDSTGLTGFKSPSVHERYFFVRKWAAASRGLVRIAMVARPEMIDPEKFGVTVAQNAGLSGDVFLSMEDAWAWIKGGDASRENPTTDGETTGLK